MKTDTTMDDITREEIEEALVNHSATAKALGRKRVVGNSEWTSPWDKIHQRINELLDDLDARRLVASAEPGPEVKRSTIFVVSTKDWFDIWLSGQTRHERSPLIRHVAGSLQSTHGLVITPEDMVIFGDTERWASSIRLMVMERIQLAMLAGGHFGEVG